MNVVIIGASRGIGKAIARKFVEEDPSSNYLLTWNTNAALMMKTKNEMKVNVSGVIRIKHLDVTNRKEVRGVLSGFVSEYGLIDVLINNAGITRNAKIVDMQYKDWDDVISTNLTGIFNVLKESVPFLAVGASIINLGSVTGLTGAYGASGYSASKAGIHALTKSAAKELAPVGVRVNAVSPGFVETDLLHSLPERVLERIKEKTLLKRLGTVEEIAEFVYFIVVKGTYCTGQLYLIDGGYRE